jgi:hypothetical protein
MKVASKIKDVTALPAFKKWFGNSKVVDSKGNPLVVYHATTHKFFEFTRDRGNVENHFGLGHYFTDSKTDAETNYLLDGADLTSRIEQLAERIESDEEIDRAKAKAKAKKMLAGKSQIVLPFYLKFENPINVTKDKDATRYDALESEDEEGNYIENEDSLPMKLYNAINDVANYDFQGVNAQQVWNDISEVIGDWDYALAYDVDVAFRHSSALLDVQDDKGDLASNEFIRKVYEEMGFDGIIMDADLQFGSGRKYGKKMVMDAGTRHYIAFNSNQIKLADGSNTEFDGNNPDIRFGGGGNINKFTYTIGGL